MPDQCCSSSGLSDDYSCSLHSRFESDSSLSAPDRLFQNISDVKLLAAFIQIFEEIVAKADTRKVFKKTIYQLQKMSKQSNIALRQIGKQKNAKSATQEAKDTDSLQKEFHNILKQKFENHQASQKPKFRTPERSRKIVGELN